METFLSIHRDVIIGTLSTFYRLIFKDHLTSLYPQGAFARFLNSQQVLLKDFATYAETTTARLEARAQQVAADAKRAAGFGMRVLYHSRARRPDLEKSLNIEYADFESLLRESDFITIHTPLDDSTHHLFGDSQFAKMKPTSILVNTARGPIIDPAALRRALPRGAIAAAALDVTEPEPIPPDSPLLELDNLIITPHIASASIQTRDKVAAMAAANLIAGLKGERLPHCVNPQVYGITLEELP